MIGHDTISYHSHTTEPFTNAHEPYKLLTLIVPENKIPVHHPGDVMIESNIGIGVGRRLETTLAHEAA
jgi:hypothetical protein